MSIRIHASYDSFRDLRRNQVYYIDKTEVIQEYLVNKFDKAILFARPRRFGKTLTMTMFRDFLDIRQDNRDIFKGLKILAYTDTVNEYMNRYPVIFLSLKELYGKSRSDVFRSFQITISRLFDEYSDLLQSSSVKDIHKDFFLSLQKKESNEADTLQAVDLLCRMLYDHYGKPSFILIDEYDVPIAKALGTDVYDYTRDLIEHMLSYVCKTNDTVKAVILSGCLFTVKNSTYTGLNNIIPYTVLSPNFASSIGFTEEDVKQLLADAGLPERHQEIREWYDGYLFGREHMYCPWDVLRYVSSVLDGSYSTAMGPESYWVNTSETSQNIIHGFLGRVPGVMENFEQLLAGKSIDCPVNDTIPYHRIHESGENLWSALLETGYLTKAVTERMPLMPLRIPNREILDVFRQEVWSYFKDKVENAFVRDLTGSLWAGECDHAEQALNQILEATLSFYHEYHEYSYHLILDGLFTGLGYRVLSETESGYGRSDLIIPDPARSRCLILELKHVKGYELLECGLQEAIDQIAEKKYASRMIYDGFKSRFEYGIAFCDKKCRIEKIQR